MIEIKELTVKLNIEPSIITILLQLMILLLTLLEKKNF